MAFCDHRIRGTPRQELLLLRHGGLPRPRVLAQAGQYGFPPWPDRRQPVRGVGVRPAGRQPERQAHHRRRADPEGRIPRRAAGEDPPRLRQHLPPVHPGQRRRPPDTPAGPGVPARTRRRRDTADRGAGRAAVQAAYGRAPQRRAMEAAGIPRLVRPGRSVRGTTAEPPQRGCGTQPGTGGAGSRD